MNKKLGKEKARKYYDQEAERYIEMYGNKYGEYPANLIRIKFVAKRLAQNKIKSLLDIGCGTCGPMIRLLKAGIKCKGIDFSPEMVKEGKRNLQRYGFEPDLISHGDIESNSILSKERFNAAMALGVFPHILNERKALLNMRKMLKNNGRVFIEFRNDLFAAFSMNRYSIDFFLNRVIDFSGLPRHLRNEVIQFYSNRLKVQEPVKKGNKILYTDILAKFHNPLTIEKDLFMPNGFVVDKIHFYHYHALPPIFEKKYPELFKELSFKLEKPEDWKGCLLASAFVVEAHRID